MLNSYETLEKRVKEKNEKKRLAVAAAHDGHTLQGVSGAFRQ